MGTLAVFIYVIAVILAVAFSLIYRYWLIKSGKRDIPSVYQSAQLSNNGIPIKESLPYFKIVNR